MSKIAKASFREALWTSLGLTPQDGTHWREYTSKETIVLALKPAAKRDNIPATWEGFAVKIVPYEPFEAL